MCVCGCGLDLVEGGDLFVVVGWSFWFGLYSGRGVKWGVAFCCFRMVDFGCVSFFFYRVCLSDLFLPFFFAVFPLPFVFCCFGLLCCVVLGF